VLEGGSLIALYGNNFFLVVMDSLSPCCVLGGAIPYSGSLMEASLR
jgi:hypothetical protein